LANKKIDDKTATLNGEMGKLIQAITLEEEKINKFGEIGEQLEETNKQFKLLKILESCLGKDGLPLRILQNYLEPIANQINSIISPFISRKIVLKIDKDDLIMDSFPTTIAERSVYMHGGMESFILDIAFKITLSNFAKLPKCNILFLDEGISAFDSERLNNIDMLFGFISNYFPKTVLITHLESVKDNITEKIEIIKENGQSRIICNY